MNVGTGGDVGSTGEVTAAAATLQGAPRPVVLDVGANIGDYTAAVRRISAAARIYAFEPAPAVCAELRQRFADDAGVSVWQIALSDTAGSAALFGPPTHTGLASLVQRDLRHVGLSADPVATVPTVPLDAFAAEHALDEITLLKLDVEGHELAVLRGAERLLGEGRVRAVQFEFGGANVDSRTFLRDFYDLLGDFAMHRVLRRGLQPLGPYRETYEIFTTTNFLAVRGHA
jgi:FkbM family methyltransferase